VLTETLNHRAAERTGVVELLASLDTANALWIDGMARDATDSATFEVVDPATLQLIARVSDANSLDAVCAVDAAAAAFDEWSAAAPRERSEILRRSFELMQSRTEVLAELISWENGKSMPDARAEVHYAAEFFRWFAEEAARPEGEFRESPAGGARTVVTRRPVGVSAHVTPWNFPAAMATRKIGPALAAGCTVVLKPAAETPLTALAIARILAEAGLPRGVVNVVPTQNAQAVVTAWLEDPRVRKLSFTGSTAVGRSLLRQAADRVLNSSMELGGNAPFVVADDADVDAAVLGAMTAKFRNGGQACTAANRFYVHQSIVDQFVSKLGAAVTSLKVGQAADETSQVGPLISDKALKAVDSLVQQAIEGGAAVSHRGVVPSHLNGYFYPPTVLVGVAPDASILKEEIFGPVAPVVTWKDERELLELLNDTELGLAAYVYSRDLERAIRLAESIEAGMVGVNRGVVSDPAAPFGGMKESGLGREGARDGVREFQETQYLSIDWPRVQGGQ
jgi:succinate-semialdehyde dehydrogenase/glutarate-semialdehyde dehydrogenase